MAVTSISVGHGGLPEKVPLEKVPEGDPQSPRGEEARVSWSDFTQATTCHGIRFIFTRGAHVWRRALWASVVLASVTVFTVQLSVRTHDYFKYETTTDIKVEYVTSIPFPAVTVCNQNSFRISKTTAAGIFRFADRFFDVNGQKADDNDNIEPNLVFDLPADIRATSSREFLKSIDHQIEDIIEKCYWRRKSCNLTTDFIPVLSENGLCYTFNHGRDESILHATNLGMHELRLILNAEVYEHMKGLNDDSGIKIFLHDPSDRALTSKRGIMLSAGKHAKIRLERDETVQLPHPFGTCSETANLSRTSCLTRCVATTMSNDCRCKLPYDIMDDSHLDYDVCTTEQMFGCVWNDTRERDHPVCDCEVPCTSTEYTHDLSLSDLSSFNIRRLIFSHDRQSTRQRHLKEKFLTAQEARQRSEEEISATNDRLDDEFQSGMSRLNESLRIASSRLTSQRLIDDITSLRLGVADDKRLLNTTLMELWFTFAKHVVNAQTLARQADNIRAFFDAMNLLTSDPSVPMTLADELWWHCAGESSTDFSQLDYYFPGAAQTISNSKAGSSSIPKDPDYEIGSGEEHSGEDDGDHSDGGGTVATGMGSMSSIEEWMNNSTSWCSYGRRRRKRSTGNDTFEDATSGNGPGGLDDGTTPPVVPQTGSPGGNLSTTNPHPYNTTLMTSGPPTTPSGNWSASTPHSYNTTPLSANPSTPPKPPPSLCDTTVSNLVYFLHDHESLQLVTDISSITASMSNLADSYLGDVNTKCNSSDSTLKLEKIPEHDSCLQTLTDIQDGWLPYLQALNTSLSNISRPDYVALQNLADVVQNISTFPDVDPALYTDALQCFWLSNYISMDSMDFMLRKFEEAEGVLFHVDSIRMELAFKADILASEYMERRLLQEQASSVARHRAGEQEKLDLAWLFDDDLPVLMFEGLTEKTEGYSRSREYFDSELNKVLFNMKSVLELLDSAQIPVLSDKSKIFVAWRNLYRQHVARNDSGSNSGGYVGGSGNGDGHDYYYPRVPLEEVVTTVMDKLLMDEVDLSIMPVETNLKAFLKANKELSVSLQEYIEECKFNDGHFMKNFLMVDISFDELKVTRVEQKEAFGILSLLGEIGGFLGLLLGASVLTVCELIDFMILKSKTAAAARKKINPGSQAKI